MNFLGTVLIPIRRDPDGLIESPDHLTGKRVVCSFCDSHFADSEFCGRTNIYCCFDCAIGFLPRFIAGTVNGHCGDASSLDHFTRQQDTILKAYWSAVSSFLMDRINKIERESQSQ